MITHPLPWSKKQSLLRCACGALAVRKKHGENICQRCDELEQGARRKGGVGRRVTA